MSTIYKKRVCDLNSLALFDQALPSILLKVHQAKNSSRYLTVMMSVVYKRTINENWHVCNEVHRRYI